MEQLTTTREERGKAIVEKNGQIKKVDDHSYTVKSRPATEFIGKSYRKWNDLHLPRLR